MKRIRLIAAEDDEDYRKLIQTILDAQEDMELCALCANGADALSSAIAFEPDVVLMDLNLDTNELDGAETARQIRLKTNAQIVILTAFDSPEVVVSACRRSFASSYVLKSQASLLLPTIRATAQGATPQSLLICASLLGSLSPAERTVFERMMGRNVVLHSKEKTIANQQSSILRKMGLSTKEELNHIFTVYYPPQRKAIE